MFSIRQKQILARVIEETILGFEHPEMPREKPLFRLHVIGKENWSWAEIEPNWTFENKEPTVNPHNEAMDPLSGTKLRSGQS
jgi:hypothetical protein